MRTITKTFKLYEFSELSQDKKSKAIADHIGCEIELMTEESPYYHCVTEMREMQTPWFLGECIHEHYHQEIAFLLRSSLFFKDGSFIPGDYYPENWHEERELCENF